MKVLPKVNRLVRKMTRASTVVKTVHQLKLGKVLSHRNILTSNKEELSVLMIWQML